MTLSKDQLRELDEAALRRDVLLPLFRAMGFGDVFEYHGGVLEQGKDIVMWKAGEFGERTNYAVVVKATKVTGQATGKGSANEICFQLQQALGSSYNDPRTGEKRTADCCIVVSNHEITKEAIESINNALPTGAAPRVRQFIDIEVLWELIQQHQPRRTVVDSLRKAKQVLDTASDVYHVHASTEGAGVKLSLKLRDGVDPAQAMIHGTIRVGGDTPEGRDAIAALQRHLSTGEGATIRGAAVRLALPQGIQDIVGEFPEEGQTLVLGPRRSAVPVLASVRLVSPDGMVTIQESLKFEMTQVGSEEATIVADASSVPWRWTFKLQWNGQRIDLNWSYDLLGAPVRRALDAVRFARALAIGGRLEFTRADTGQTILGFDIESGKAPAPDPCTIHLLERALMIQEKTGVVLTVPTRELTELDVESVLSTATIVETGTLTASSSACTFSIPSENLQALIDALRTEGMLQAQFRDTPPVDVFGSRIHLGPSEVTLTNFRATEETLLEMEGVRDASDRPENFSVHLTAEENLQNVHTRYERWVSE